ncbi:MAG: DNA polymerase-1, partial [Limisphaerales bacterium]
TEAERKDLARQLAKQKAICFETMASHKDPNEADLIGISFVWKKGEAYFLPLPTEKENAILVLEDFKSSLESTAQTKLSKDIKFDRIILRWYGIDLKGEFLDTMIAHYLIEPERKHDTTYLSESYLGYTPITIDNIIGKAGKNQLSWRDADPERISNYACELADLSLQLHDVFEPIIKEQKIDELYRNMEIPLAKVLSNLEYEGIRVDTDFLGTLSETMNTELIDLRTKIFEIADEEFNMDSPKQLGIVLFDKLEIEYKGKKTKTGQYSTSEDVLSKLGDQEIVAHILEYREIGKLKSTYVDALPNLINSKTGRVHTTLSQTVAATGRLSSNNPNLQNIPIRTARGRQIRKAFIPRDKDHLILSADYSQIELRIIASISKDKAMMQAFNDNIDIHTATAAKVYGVDLEEVTREMRSKAKMVNFSISYGVTAFGLAQRLSIPRKEAAELISNYFDTYPGVKQFMEDIVVQAKEEGYVETLLGRRRYLKDINSKNHTIRSHAERNAVNSPIQGTAADMIKLAMIDVDKAMGKANMKSVMTLQVHDELVFDARKEEVDELKHLVEENMRNAFKLDVPIIVEAGIGDNWLEAH